MKKKENKNEKYGAILLAIMIIVAGYIMVSSATKHTALDNEQLYQWRLNWADRR